MCVYLCSVLQIFLWKNHARLLQNQQDWHIKSKFSPFLRLPECPREELMCPGCLCGTVRWEFSIPVGTEGPAPPHLLRAFLLCCPWGIPRAAAAQKPPVHSILISTMCKFSWRSVLGRISLNSTVPAHGSAAASLQHKRTLPTFGSLLSFCTFPFDHTDHSFVLVEIFNFCH